jgi:hypothetical protein
MHDIFVLFSGISMKYFLFQGTCDIVEISLGAYEINRSVLRLIVFYFHTVGGTYIIANRNYSQSIEVNF